MEWLAWLGVIIGSGGGAYGIIAFVNHGRRPRNRSVTGKVTKPKIYQEPFDHLNTSMKKDRFDIESQKWLVEFYEALRPEDKLVADGYVPGTISSNEARLLEYLYKADKVQFAQLVKKLNSRSYAFPNAESKLLNEISVAWDKAVADKKAKEREAEYFKKHLPRHDILNKEFDIGAW